MVILINVFFCSAHAPCESCARACGGDARARSYDAGYKRTATALRALEARQVRGPSACLMYTTLSNTRGAPMPWTSIYSESGREAAGGVPEAAREPVSGIPAERVRE